MAELTTSGVGAEEQRAATPASTDDESTDERKRQSGDRDGDTTDHRWPDRTRASPDLSSSMAALGLLVLDAEGEDLVVLVLEHRGCSAALAIASPSSWVAGIR